MMESLGKIVGTCLLLYLLVMALNFIHVNNIQLPNISGSTASVGSGK